MTLQLAMSITFIFMGVVWLAMITYNMTSRWWMICNTSLKLATGLFLLLALLNLP